MARRRKSSNGKGKGARNKERSISSETEVQEEDEGKLPKDSDSNDDLSTSPTEPTSIKEDLGISVDEPRNHSDLSQDKLMPLDIQQMILGDLQSAGRGDEIIVSRESAGDVFEDDVEELEGEIGTVVELPREEYEIHTEEDEEEELIFMNDDDDEGEENQYVIVVNSDFEVDDTSQEVVSVHNLSELQEGSCEIITVLRESDYESSQESVDGMEEEECDNINAVIGTVDGIHCVKISQYNSDDELSNHEDSLEKDEIRVTEHETEIDCLSNAENNTIQNIVENYENDNKEISVDYENLQIKNQEDNKASCCLRVTDDSDSSKADKITLEEHDKVVIVEDQVLSNDTESDCAVVDEKLEGDTSEMEIDYIPVVDEKLGDVSGMEIDADEEIDETDIKIRTESQKVVELDLINEQASNNSKEAIERVSIELCPNKELKCLNENISKIIGLESDMISASSFEVDEKRPSCNILNEDMQDMKQSRLPDSSEGEIGVKTIDSKSTVILGDTGGSSNLCLNQPASVTKDSFDVLVKSEPSSKNVQEHKVTSNSGVTENTLCVSSLETSVINQSLKEETVNNSPSDYFCVQNSNDKLDTKVDSAVKEEVLVLKDESVFRSRSGSTDTTGSESGSNSSSGRRRSGRIRSFGALKQSESDIGSKSGSIHSTAVVTSTTTPPVPGYELDKPVKVKSRWRRSSELEMGSSNRRQQDLEVINAIARSADSDNTSTPPPRSGQPSTPPDTPPPDKEVEDILLNFQNLDCNEYLTDRSRSKDAKRMVCDCTLTKEEMARGDMGCGEDCLNRLLMIECGTRCMLGERCANKRFQNLEYAKCEVFKTDMKGCGLRALEDIPEDTFLLEYVGEVLDPKEFRRRAKDYAKDKNRHYYFMALKSDSIIDATQKGNISRFINHSCDPNAETQKWTVNGELRVGFFSKRLIAAGEEVTFDYQLQRYGKEAQRCHCQTTLCRGWIGEDPEKENKWSDLSGRNRERKEKERKKKEDKRNVKDTLNDIDLEEEIEKLVLKNRAQTLMLCRLMVRAEDHSSRVQLLRILQKGETACLRLFLDYHGLRLIWSWMMDPASTSSLKIEILETLAKLPIPNKTMLQDSKVLSVIEKWSTTALTVTEAKDRSSTEDETDKVDIEKDKPVKGSDSEKSSDDSNTSKPVETEEQQEINKKKIVEIANTLLKEWTSLKEVFRIPKRERIEQMKEHEREADKVCKDSSVEKQDKSYDRHWNHDKYRNDYDRRDKDRDRDRDKDRKRGRDSPDSDKARKSARTDDRQSQLTKMERRQLFAIKAAQDEEERQRQRQENMWQEQVHLAAQELAAKAQQEANNYPNFPAFPAPQQWLPYPPPDPNMMPPQHMDAQHMFNAMNHANPPPPFLFNQNGPHLHQHPPFLDPNHNSPFHNPVNPMFNQPPPIHKQPLLPTPNQPMLLTPPLPKQPLLPTSNQPLLHTPPLPNQPFMHNQQNQPILPNHPPLPNHPHPMNHPPLPNQPHPMNLPPFTTQPPLPIQPPPMVITSQPPLNTLGFPHDVNQPQHFQNPMPPQNQYSQPPPFTSQPPLPTLPPNPSPQPVFKNPLPTQFQPPLPQPPLPQPQTTVVPVTSSTVSSVPLFVPTPVRLPPKWKTAKDAEGRTYYYHVKTRVSQWEPPVWEQQVVQDSESESDSSDSNEEDSSSEEEEQEDVKMEEDEPEPVEEVVNDDDLGCEELGDSPYEPETMELLEDIVEDTRIKRKDVLVQERIISPRTAEEMPEKLDKRKIRELKEKLRRQKSKEKLRLKQKSKSKGRSGTSKCEADTSSDPGRKIKDAFRLNMAGVIVHYLNAYRKPDCKFGKINNTEDFKHIARKLTHFVMLKELKHCRSVDELECNDNVKHKARDFIKKYMAKFGPVYQRPSDDD